MPVALGAITTRVGTSGGARPPIDKTTICARTAKCASATANIACCMSAGDSARSAISASFTVSAKPLASVGDSAAESELCARSGAVLRAFRALDRSQREAIRPHVLGKFRDLLEPK